MIATVPLAGCTSPKSSPPPRTPVTAPASSRPATPAPDPAPRALIPPAFDGTAGWQVETDGTGTTFDSPAVAAASRVVVLVATSADQQQTWLVAHDERTGAVRWTSRPVAVLSTRGALTYIKPELLLTREGGKGYAVLAMAGTVLGDAVNPDRVTAVLDIYDAASSGTGIQPLRQVSLDGSANGFAAQRDNGLLSASLENDLAHPLAADEETVDAATGTVTDYPASALVPPASCQECEAGLAQTAGATPWGTVADSVGGSWLSGGWYSGDLKPAGTSGAVTSFVAPNGSVVSAWSTSDFLSGAGVWTVQDAHTGNVMITLPCSAGGALPGPNQNAAITSDDGRFLIAQGLQAFDLKAGKGFCFAATADQNQITLISLDGEDATAYGQGGQNAPVSVSLTTGQATPLPDQTVLPTLIGGDAAVFGTTTTDGQPIDVYPRRAS